MMAKDHGNKSP